MSDKDRWSHQGYQELLRQNNQTSSLQQNQHYHSVSKRQHFRYNTANSKQSQTQSWKQSRAFQQPYKNHFGNNHYQKRYNRNFNNSEAIQRHHNYHNNNNNFHHHPNSKANHHYSKRGKYNQNGCGQKQKFQSQEKWQHSNYRQQDQYQQRHQRGCQKFEERLQKEQEKPSVEEGGDDARRESIRNVTREKRSQQQEHQNDWKFNQNKLQLHQLLRMDSSITTNSTVYDSNDQELCQKKFKSQKKFYKKKYNQKSKAPFQSKITQNQEQQLQTNDPFLQNDQRVDNQQEEQKIYAPYEEEEEQQIFCQDDNHSVPTQPSPSNLSLFAEIPNAPSPVVPITLPKTAPLSASPQNSEKQTSLEFNPVILKVKLQTQKGPIDVSIRQLDNLTQIATQICQQYNLNQNLIPAIAYQFEYALQTLSYGYPNPNQAVMPSYQPLEIDNANYSQVNNLQDTYLNNQQQFQN